MQGSTQWKKAKIVVRHLEWLATTTVCSRFGRILHVITDKYNVDTKRFIMVLLKWIRDQFHYGTGKCNF